MKNKRFCTTIKDALDENRELTDEQLRHLLDCPGCRKYRETLKALQSIEEPVPELYARFQAKAAGQAGVSYHESHPWYYMAAPIAASLLLVFGGISLVRLLPQTLKSQTVTVASAEETEVYNPEESDLEYYYEIAYR